jgi:mannose-6-phosphate isomerase
MMPIALGDNRVPDVYMGGKRIDAFRARAPALPGSDLSGPEDWVGSLTLASAGLRARLGRPSLGRSTTADGRLLTDVAAADPEARLLVKLLDAGQRLPVHYHPTTEFARRHLGAAHGKTEAWLVVEAAPDAAVWLGWRRPVSRDDVGGWVQTQDAAALLDALERMPVAAGDVFFVPGGVPHAIGAGILLVEVQEPSSLSILLEHRPFGVGEADAHLGVGWELALDSLDLAAHPAGYLRPAPRPGALLGPQADPFFRMQRLTAEAGVEIDDGHGVLIVLEGSGEIRTAGGTTPACAGQTWFIPRAAGRLETGGSLDAILCRPGRQP